MPPIATRGYVDSGCSTNCIGDAVMCTDVHPTPNGICVGQPDTSQMRSSHTCLLPTPHISHAARKAHILPAMNNRALISFGQIYDDGFRVNFNEQFVLIRKGKLLLTGCRKRNTSLYFFDFTTTHQTASSAHQTSQALATFPSPDTFSAHLVHEITTQKDFVQYLHCADFSPVLSTWIAAIDNGFFVTWPGLTSDLVRKHLPKSMATAKGHLRQEQKNLRSTKQPPTSIIPETTVMTTPETPVEEPGL